MGTLLGTSLGEGKVMSPEDRQCWDAVPWAGTLTVPGTHSCHHGLSSLIPMWGAPCHPEVWQLQPLLESQHLSLPTRPWWGAPGDL